MSHIVTVSTLCSFAAVALLASLIVVIFYINNKRQNKYLYMVISSALSFVYLLLAMLQENLANGKAGIQTAEAIMYAAALGVWCWQFAALTQPPKRKDNPPVALMMRIGSAALFIVTTAALIISALNANKINIVLTDSFILSGMVAALAASVTLYVVITPKKARSREFQSFGYTSAAALLLGVIGQAANELLTRAGVPVFPIAPLCIFVSTIIVIYFIIDNLFELYSGVRALTMRIHESERSVNLETMALGMAEEFEKLFKIVATATALMQKENRAIPKALDALRQTTEKANRYTTAAKGFTDKSAHGFSEMDVTEIIRDVHLLLMHEFRSKNIEFVVAIPKNLKLFGVKYYMRQMFYNLVHNALDAMEENGMVRLTIAVDKTKVTVICTDTGEGLDEKALKQLFDPYAPVQIIPDAGSRRKKVLSLVAVQSLVQKMQGRITATSSQGAGTSVVITLPRIEP